MKTTLFFLERMFHKIHTLAKQTIIIIKIIIIIIIPYAEMKLNILLKVSQAVCLSVCLLSVYLSAELNTGL